MLSAAAEKLAAECLRDVDTYRRRIAEIEAEAERSAMPRQNTPVRMEGQRCGGIARTTIDEAEKLREYRGLVARVAVVDNILGDEGLGDVARLYMMQEAGSVECAGLVLGMTRRQWRAVRNNLLERIAENLMGDVAHV